MMTVEGSPVTEKELRLIEDHEKPVFAARRSFATVPGAGHWSMPLLLFTSKGQVELVVPPEHAADVESAIRAGYLR